MQAEQDRAGGGPVAVDARTAGPGAYFRTRLRPDARRAVVWEHLTAHLQRWVEPGSRVLELGAGWCDFANRVVAARVVAMDRDPVVLEAAAAHVTAEVGDCTDLSRFDDGDFDVVFASNLLEHLTREQGDRMLAEVRRVLVPGGRLVLMQPNFRLDPGRYFDDYTHVSVYTDRSLQDWLTASGWAVELCRARFMPLTLRSAGARLGFLTPWYLRSPVRPFAGQMLVVASVGGP